MKYKVALVAMLIAGASFGEFIIQWNSAQFGVFDSTGIAPIADGTQAVLIWSQGVPSLAASVDQTGVNAAGGEFLLDTTVLTDNGGRFSAAPATYFDADVGGADINSGYFFTRYFDVASLTPGGSGLYLQSTSTGPGLIVPGTPPGPADQYSDPAFAEFSAQAVNTAYSVIPEPATIGLMGIAGLGMFLGRRKSRR